MSFFKKLLIGVVLVVVGCSMTCNLGNSKVVNVFGCIDQRHVEIHVER